MLDSISGIFGSAPFLYRTSTGYFFTFFQGDAVAQQILMWIGNDGVIQHQEAQSLSGIYFAFLRGDTVVLVEYKQAQSDEPPWHGVITHKFLADGSPVLRDTLFREELTANEILIGPAFDVLDGEMRAVITTFRMSGGGDYLDYRARFIRSNAEATVVGENVTLYPAPAAGDLLHPAVAAKSDGGTVFGYVWAVGGNAQLCFREFDREGSLQAGFHSQPLEGDDWINMFELISRNRSVYVCYNQGSLNPLRQGSYVMAFPESELPVSPRVELPQSLGLAVYPNPFNGAAKIRFELPRDGNAAMTIFDVNGRRVMDLSGGYYAAGSHELSWQAEDLPSGVYWIRLSTKENVQVQKALLIR